MRKAKDRIVNNSNQTHSLNNPQVNRCQTGRHLPSALQGNLAGKLVAIIAVIALAASIALSLFSEHPVQAQLGSQPFANPSEVRYRAGEKRLRMVMKLISGQYSIPNVGTASLRQFRGWDADGPVPNLNTDAVAPGPTLRARLGDLVEISFLNTIDDSQFSYTFDTNSPGGRSSFGCDQSGTAYPGADLFPNCFHGSSTANIHFHGTHTSPDGLGDNVLVQVLPQVNQPDWSGTFNTIFNSGKIPPRWIDMPDDYQTKQMDMIQQHDAEAAAQAAKNKLPPPQSLYEADQKMIAAGQWPQYLMGAFPNFFQVPDYDTATGKFNSGGNGYNAGQAPGTHWYHAHKHGSTSLHILNGLAGAIIIESSHEGGYDHVIRRFYGWGDSYGDHEKIIVFQEFENTGQNLEKAKNPKGGGPPGQGKGSKQVLVNGKLTPTITMQPGEVQLWRLINATDGNNPGKLTNDLFQTQGFTFKQTAMDGVQFSPDNYKNQPFLTSSKPGGAVPGGIALASGNRADLLVLAPAKTGRYTFVSGKSTRNPAGTPMFFVNVTGTPVTLPNGQFPTKWAEMPKFLSDLPRPGVNDAIDPNSPVKFQWEDGRTATGLNADGLPPHFMINGKQFEETGPMIDQCMPLNGLQDWVLENWTNTAHPFHIHINPFQVLRIDTPTGREQYSQYRPVSDFVWQDVIAIPPAVISTNADGQVTNITPGRVTIRQTYVDFIGTYVLHCHILAHEDRGMMQLVRVVKAADYPARCQNNIPAHH